MYDASGWYEKNREGEERTFFIGHLVGSPNTIFEVGQQYGSFNSLRTPGITGGFTTDWDTTYSGSHFVSLIYRFPTTLLPEGEYRSRFRTRDDFSRGFYMIIWQGDQYIISYPMTYVGEFTVLGSQIAIYSYPYIVPTDTSLQILIETNGAGKAPDLPIDIDLEGVITLLFEILEELRFQTDLLQSFESDSELLGELSIQSQYQMGLLAIVVGIALGFVFVFGMRLH
jgi:hypothetical protein